MGALAQQIELSNQIWSAEVIRTKGQPVIPLFDGWFPNEDGSSTAAEVKMGQKKKTVL